VTFRQSQAFKPGLRLAPPEMEKAAEQSASADAIWIRRKLVKTLVWGPGAGAEGGREALI